MKSLDLECCNKTALLPLCVLLTVLELDRPALCSTKSALFLVNGMQSNTVFICLVVLSSGGDARQLWAGGGPTDGGFQRPCGSSPGLHQHGPSLCPLTFQGLRLSVALFTISRLCLFVCIHGLRRFQTRKFMDFYFSLLSPFVNDVQKKKNSQQSIIIIMKNLVHLCS